MKVSKELLECLFSGEFPEGYTIQDYGVFCEKNKYMSCTLEFYDSEMDYFKDYDEFFKVLSAYLKSTNTRDIIFEEGIRLLKEINEK